eukprot:scaffold17021_cov64-Phaeocystis_antarctica.AAC.2
MEVLRRILARLSVGFACPRLGVETLQLLLWQRNGRYRPAAQLESLPWPRLVRLWCGVFREPPHAQLLVLLRGNSLGQVHVRVFRGHTVARLGTQLRLLGAQLVAGAGLELDGLAHAHGAPRNTAQDVQVLRA